jgi:hypothetical protein
MSIHLWGRGGMGDAIYARPFVRAALREDPDVYINTSWPAIFADLPVKVTKRTPGLAVQQHHGDQVPDHVWSSHPDGARTLSLRYEWKRLQKRVSTIREMERLSGLQPDPLVLDLPPLPESPVSGRYAVVRPPAIRCDYPAPSREPDPAYLARAAEMLQARGYRVVTIGAFLPGLEEPNGEVPADVRFEYGELPLMQAISLAAHASVVVSGPCWLVPASAASGAPMIVLGGGCGGRNNPAALVDDRLGADHVQWLLPDRYCMCRKRNHGCPKRVRGFDRRFAALLDSLAIARAA